MSRATFGAKPAVLRCSRCGKFVGWEAARLQVVCGCRSHIELPPVLVRDCEEKDRTATRDLFLRDFGHTSVVAFGEIVNLEDAEALVAEMKGELAGALAYRVLPEALQILALATDPMWQRSGVGGHLVAEAELLARRKGLRQILFATTNDNLPALYFYQRHGYHLIEAVPGGVLAHVKDGSSPPGFGGIPIRDEIRLGKRLDR